jgi:hypothetical protein
MAECCKPSKKEFIVAKAKNFRAYIAGFNPPPEIQVYIDKFNEEMVLPTLTTIILPVVTAKAERGLAIDLVKKLTVPPEQQEEVVNKVVRYIQMFAEVISS